MTEDFASIVNFIINKVGKPANAQAYFENVKDGFKLPAIYFPEPDTIVQKSVLSNQYNFSNLLFVQVFHLTNDDAYRLANDIATALFKNACCVPLLKEDGTSTDLFVRVKVDKVSRIDDCVAQVQLSWNYNRNFEEEADKTDKININLNLGG